MPHATALPTPANPKGDGITFFGSSIITADAATIFATIMDVAGYENWNTMNQKADFPTAFADGRAIQVGDKGSLNSHLAAPDARNDLSHVTVSEIIPGTDGRWLLAWKCTDYSKHLLRPERVQEIIDLGNGTCEYRNYETMTGPMRISVKTFVGNTLDQGLERAADDLKRHVEGKA